MFYHRWNNDGVWKYSVDLDKCPLKQQNISARNSVYIFFPISFPQIWKHSCFYPLSTS